MVLSVILSVLLGAAGMGDIFCFTCDEPISSQNAEATTFQMIGIMSQIATSFFLTIVLIIQSILWCREVRDRVLIITCSPIIVSLVVTYFIMYGLTAPFQRIGFPTMSAAAMGVAVFSYFTMLQWRRRG